jgi:hypothetical protein
MSPESPDVVPADQPAPVNGKKSYMITPKLREQYIRQAEDWWNRTARHLVSQEKNSERTDRRFRAAKAGGPAIITTGEKQVVVPSGILNGKMFHNLTDAERAQVLKVWMHSYTPFQFADLAQKEKDLLLEGFTKKVFFEH